MEVCIRQEQEDYKISEKVVEKSFEHEQFTDHQEHFLVARLGKAVHLYQNCHL